MKIEKNKKWEPKHTTISTKFFKKNETVFIVRAKNRTFWNVSPSSCAKLSLVARSGYWFSLNDLYSLCKNRMREREREREHQFCSVPGRV